ncbi:MAG: tRNA preQ1(34) S-adenosylmethionine ribosyltransferase-isomerase QueA [Planctomycetes bacterium]|nr:tRNA preQ1(34) S-adenosylmethionine ribosyltransferase-isomerase QueA [Planctomycetota bacterium]
MLTEELNYELPENLIAQEPASTRDESRLMVMSLGNDELADKRFGDIIDYLSAGDCLVLNNTKVLSARFFGHRQSGAKLEGLMLDETENGDWEVMLKNARKVKAGESIVLSDINGADHCMATAIERTDEGTWLIRVESEAGTNDVLDEIGYAPLPPYIKRDADKGLAAMDLKRYQTVYAKKPGAVAAPTAGLHFSNDLLARIEQKGVKLVYVTLHVGAGTFKPVTAENLDDHNMHSERYSVSEKTAGVINGCIEGGGRVIAVGTTTVRTLESVANGRKVEAGDGRTRIFIQPGFEFQVVDAMVTNFHLPKSTLLALVGAMAGLDKIMKAYEHAIEQRYRFYSYGDAMLII